MKPNCISMPMNCFSFPTQDSHLRMRHICIYRYTSDMSFSHLKLNMSKIKLTIFILMKICSFYPSAISVYDISLSLGVQAPNFWFSWLFLLKLTFSSSKSYIDCTFKIYQESKHFLSPPPLQPESLFKLHIVDAFKVPLISPWISVQVVVHNGF